MLVNIQRQRPNMAMRLLLWKHYFSVVKRQQQKFVHSRNRKIFYKSLSIEQRRKRYNRIPRVALVDPSDSPWRKLYLSQDDQAMITATGLDCSTFECLLSKFKPLYENLTPHSNNGKIEILKRKTGAGRRRIIEATDCLGLILMWTRTRGSMFSLQMKFGMTGTPTGLYIRFARRLLLHIFSNDNDAAIRLPSDQEIEEYKNAIKSRHPLLDEVWCTMDGVKLMLESSGIPIEQNMFYNGWTHDTYVSNVICFCPDGTIPITCFNVPGCQHDSTIAEWGNVYKKLEKVYRKTNGKCVVDSAFNKTRCDFLIKSSQQDPEGTEAFQLNIEATSMRQSAEWGMRAFQSSFPRLKDRMRYEKFGERRVILKMCMQLYNLRARKVGINQIKNTYMPCLDKEFNLNN